MGWTVPDNKKNQRKSPSPTTIIEPISNKRKKNIQIINDGLSFNDKIKLMDKDPEYREKHTN